jgi:hypothetical protein
MTKQVWESACAHCPQQDTWQPCMMDEASFDSFAVVQHTTSYCFLEQNKLKPNLLVKSNFNCSNATLQCALTIAHSNLVLPTITALLGYGYLELSQGV